MGISLVQVASTKETDFEIDETDLEKKRLEAEEKRLAELRAQGTPVTPQSFAEWKHKFDAEVRLKKAELEPEAVVRDKGPSGKIFFQNQDVANATQAISISDHLSQDTKEILPKWDFVCLILKDQSGILFWLSLAFKAS